MLEIPVGLRSWLPAVAAAAGVCALPAQTTWFVRGSDADVRIVGGPATVLRGPLPAPQALPAGDHAVHFGTDAAGKPISLLLEVPDGAFVSVAIAGARAAIREVVPLDGDDRWRTATGQTRQKVGWTARCSGSEQLQDYRLVATGTGRGEGTFGIAARWVDAHTHYRFVWDRAAAELRLERQLGADPLVIARCAAPPVDDVAHTLALQVEGFRLQAFCDDALVLQALDGAVEKGSFGTWSTADAVAWSQVALEPPAAPRASSAVVATPTAAVFTGATELAAGHFHVLELRLDRPYALLPTSDSGLEPWLLQCPAAPVIALGDWRSSLGAGAIGEVPRGGLFRSELHWPDGLWLQQQVVLVRALLVSPDGAVVVGATPPVPLWM